MASFWEEFKDLFKTDSQREEERQNALNAALDAEKAVTEKLAALGYTQVYDVGSLAGWPYGLEW